MKEFTEPIVEVIELVDDVIATSSGCDTDTSCRMDCPDDCVHVCDSKCEVV